ncbi:Rpp20 subunit of nuclear RNase MRP and P-domain-containing protein [Xylariales sp. PMI_506]|nr:Rpp20 subunit of nuclear RNase MRP and P-domain-containing protein [Xylariales sp. PMI_506]
MAPPHHEKKSSPQEQQLPKKLPPIQKGQKVNRLTLTPRIPSSSQAHRLYVNPRTPFRSITTRVRKQLDKSLRTASAAADPQSQTNRLASRAGLSLSARINMLAQHHGTGSSGIGLERAREVVVVGAGKAIPKVVNVAAFFQGQRDCEVRLKTGSLGAVDEVLDAGDEDEDEDPEDVAACVVGGEMRERMVSYLEVTIRLL